MREKEESAEFEEEDRCGEASAEFGEDTRACAPVCFYGKVAWDMPHWRARLCGKVEWDEGWRGVGGGVCRWRGEGGPLLAWLWGVSHQPEYPSGNRTRPDPYRPGPVPVRKRTIPEPYHTGTVP